jgi:hypothetical protein
MKKIQLTKEEYKNKYNKYIEKMEEERKLKNDYYNSEEYKEKQRKEEEEKRIIQLKQYEEIKEKHKKIIDKWLINEFKNLENNILNNKNIYDEYTLYFDNCLYFKDEKQLEIPSKYNQTILDDIKEYHMSDYEFDYDDINKYIDELLEYLNDMYDGNFLQYIKNYLPDFCDVSIYTNGINSNEKLKYLTRNDIIERFAYVKFYISIKFLNE